MLSLPIALSLKHTSFRKDCVKVNNAKFISLDSKNPIKANSFAKLSKHQKDYINKSINYVNNFINITKTSGKDISDDIDIFTYSFPCQDLSNQGNKKGMKENTNTRSSLIWQIKKILTDKDLENRPKYLLMENVPQVNSSKNKKEFDRFIKSLDDLGYNSQIYFLNAADYGLCQRRVRCFLLSVRKDYQKIVDFKFPIEFNKKHKTNLKSILDKDTKHKYLTNLEKYKLSEFKLSALDIRKARLIGYSENFHCEAYVYDPNYLGPTLTASGALLRIKILENNHIRLLTAKECIKYMNFPANSYQILKQTKLLSDTDIVFLCGNSICVNVLGEIFKCLIF